MKNRGKLFWERASCNKAHTYMYMCVIQLHCKVVNISLLNILHLHLYVGRT